MRKLKAKDIAPFTKLIAKMGLKDSIKIMFGGSKKQGDLVGELVWGIVENYSKAEKDFFEFLAELNGQTPDEIAELSINDFINLVKELLSEENLPFFKSAAK